MSWIWSWSVFTYCCCDCYLWEIAYTIIPVSQIVYTIFADFSRNSMIKENNDSAPLFWSKKHYNISTIYISCRPTSTCSYSLRFMVHENRTRFKHVIIKYVENVKVFISYPLFAFVLRTLFSKIPFLYCLIVCTYCENVCARLCVWGVWVCKACVCKQFVGGCWAGVHGCVFRVYTKEMVDLKRITVVSW